jgi:hypothetical protein
MLLMEDMAVSESGMAGACISRPVSLARKTAKTGTYVLKSMN